MSRVYLSISDPISTPTPNTNNARNATNNAVSVQARMRWHKVHLMDPENEPVNLDGLEVAHQFKLNEPMILRDPSETLTRRENSMVINKWT